MIWTARLASPHASPSDALGATAATRRKTTRNRVKKETTVLALLALVLLAGCALPPTGPLFVPAPEPGGDCALVYVYRYRANDKAFIAHPAVDFNLNGRLLANLHYEGYTHTCLRPGDYTARAVDDGADVIKPHAFVLSPSDAGKTFRLVMFISREISEYQTFPFRAKSVTVGTWKFEEVNRTDLALLEGFRLQPSKQLLP